ncbi:MAG TPA: hypothetical protein DHV62_09615 [Elusimicrobia bacterium]|nr:hypothetical protein [Elusimicrobiota bacterium]
MPSEESQYFPQWGYDAFDCTAYSFLNLLETKLNQMLAEKTITLDNADWLSTNGYLDKYGKLNFSDQFTAVLSGNTKQGNTFENVFASSITDGLIPDSMFQDNPKNWEEYYDKTKITQEMRDTGKEFLKRFEISELRNVPLSDIGQDLIWTTIAVCEGYNSGGIIQSCVFPPTHAVLLFNKADSYYEFFDSYPPYIKQTSLNYIYYAKWRILIKETNQPNLTMLKTIRQKGTTETFVVIAGKNYYIGSPETFDRLKREEIIGGWDKVQEVPTHIPIDGIIK